tara:strand:+ start:172 stop:948 length:777 start_codon:yes stop_codon:yes gene_type:complete
MKFKTIKEDPCNYGKIKMSCDDDLIPDCQMVEPLRSFKNGFNIAIIGSSGSGKTNLLISLLTKKKKDGIHRSFHKCFHKIIVVSPSLHTLGNNIFKDIPDERKFSDFDINTLESIYLELDKSQVEQEDEKEKIFNLIILDDVGSKLKGGAKERLFVSLMQNRRHHNASIITIGQRFRDLSHGHRSNLTHAFIFRPKTFLESDAIFSELVGIPLKEQKEFIKFLYDDGRYNHLMIDFTQYCGQQGYKFYKSFKLIEMNE